MSDKLFFSEVESQGNAAKAKYMALRGQHGGAIDSSISNVEDLKNYNSQQSETQGGK